MTPEKPVRPPATRPPPQWRPGTRPNTWRRPTANNWWWHGRAMRRIHGPAWSWPSGWAYRRWSVGAFLPGLFLTNPYFWSDWMTLGLPGPPPGYRWVRWGPDLLLVQLSTGRIVDVAYGVFI